MNMRFIKIVVVIWGALIFVACEREKNPYQTDVDGTFAIRYLGRVEENDSGGSRFRAFNNSQESVWYWGYQENYPLYLVQTKTDTGWVNRGGWCGTGALMIEFKASSSFDFKVFPPKKGSVWRVGISLHNKDGHQSQIIWSDSLVG